MVKAVSVYRKPYSRVQVCFSLPSRTKEAFQPECDIRNIMAQYKRTGVLTHVNKLQAQYADVSNLLPYQEALNQVMLADQMFASLPAQLRARFQNDPSEFLAFVENPSNVDEMRSLGLLEPEASPDVKPVREVVED